MASALASSLAGLPPWFSVSCTIILLAAEFAIYWRSGFYLRGTILPCAAARGAWPYGRIVFCNLRPRPNARAESPERARYFSFLMLATGVDEGWPLYCWA